jgi:uncharacterized membrane protein YjjB (DUF3815 family)
LGLRLLFHHAVCGGLAAAGFGILFNIGFPAVPLCAACGGLMLAVRTVALGLGWNLEAASFLAALAGGVVVQMLPSTMGVSRNALHVVGCIPMIPGGFAAKAMLGLFAITTSHSTATNEILIAAMDNILRVMFTIGALGTGLAIPTLLLPIRLGKASNSPSAS